MLKFTGNDQCQLLRFCDASGKAFGTTVYLRCIKENHISINLIFSKSRIAPNKELSIPRLELLAVLLGARSLKFVEKSLQLKMKEMILWTDSKCVLHWLRSKKMLSSFIQRRGNEIKSNGSIDFRYVATHDNPGDIASKGMSTNELQKCKLWWHQPNWLSQDKDNWPLWNVREVSKEILAGISKEIKAPKTMFEIYSAAGEGPLEISHESIGKEYSNHNKLVHKNVKSSF